MESNRKIIHIDMDAFFASIEQRDNPSLRGKPIAVGSPDPRGVVATASYEARKYGIHSAMASQLAKKKCPGLIFVKPHFDVYKEVSRQIQSIFSEYTDLVEPLSLDEAFLDVTYHKKGRPSATLIALEIKQRILDTTKLTASAGVSFNKFLAKVASDIKKPNGIFVVTPADANTFISNLEIEKFFGVGKVTAEKFHRIGIRTGQDLQKLERMDLIRLFGKTGNYYYDIARGIDNRPVNPTYIRKSIGTEETFDQDFSDLTTLNGKLNEIGEELWVRMDKRKTFGKTLTLKIKYADFEQNTRSKTFQSFITQKEQMKSTAMELLLNCKNELFRGVRLLGLTFSNLNTESTDDAIQLTIEF
ncbi:MAG: DNA polymerase IV [Bacteroidota bacterium]|nr:DNA polymerase IV [Bacteroidota bacterium]